MMKKISTAILLALLIPVTASLQTKRSEAMLDGLRGKVKEVKTERAKFELQGNQTKIFDRHISSTVTYTPDGKLNERKSYNSDGTADMLINYMEIDGLRAMRREVMPAGNAPPPPANQPETGTFDKRFDLKFVDKFDQHGRLSEQLWIKSNGKIWNLWVERFAPQTLQTDREQWSPADEMKQMYGGKYSSRDFEKLPHRTVEWDGKKLEMILNSRSVKRENQFGHIIETFSLDDKGAPQEHLRYEQYEVDNQNNWVKRNCYKVSLVNWKEILTPYMVEYQIIKYY